jgi:hypothetical protein
MFALRGRERILEHEVHSKSTYSEQAVRDM